MIANEAIYLNKEIKRLQKYGIDAIVVPDGDFYNIKFKETNGIIEPYCTPEEVMGIIGALENVLERIKQYERSKNVDMDRNGMACYDSTSR